MNIKKISTRIFGNIVHKIILRDFNQRVLYPIPKEKKTLKVYEKILIHLKKKLIYARMDMRLHEYISILLFIYSIIIFSMFFITSFIFIVVYSIYGVVIPFVYGIIMILVMILVLIIITSLYYAYPNIAAYETKRKIDATLPYSLSYFSIMSAIGIPPYKIFYAISDAESIYGEASKEFKLIVRDVDLFGHDIVTAFRNISETTPSLNLRKILQGAITTTIAGGEISDYFLARSQEFMEERRKKYEEFIETLNMISEIYITAMVAGPLFIITLLSGLAMAGDLNIEGMQFIVYVFIPLGTLLFIFFIDVISTEVEAN